MTTKTTLPKTWDEFCEQTPISADECTFDDYGNIVPMSELIEDETERDPETDKMICSNEQIAQAVRALIQLIQLRDCYRQGWTPDWSDNNQPKYSIEYYYYDRTHGRVIVKQSMVLTFQTLSIMVEFEKNFTDLIKQAKKLI